MKVQIPPIYAKTPIELVPHAIITSFPAKTFLENIAIAADGSLFITNHEVGKVIRISPQRDPSIFASFEDKVTGIALTANGELIMTGWNSAGTSVIAGIHSDGTVTTLATLSEAQFLMASHLLPPDSTQLQTPTEEPFGNSMWPQTRLPYG